MVCRLADGAADLATHHAIRRSVFVLEQGVFAESDHDSRDDHATTLHVVGFVDGLPGGVVRLFPLDPSNPAGEWQGDRLAVLPEFRSSGLGRPLVRFAVATAARLGGSRMIAHVQPANRTFFRRLGWVQRGAPELYVGIPHLPMDIDLVVAAS
ncbi:GNAT family acetyltransferase [Pseudonocardia asaccharolytica DSM 44247 = NBRC 16224]|uniref:GNAT family acetyltransferase n=1 Tax=Pseudonocardia asaccharolytica DSM 44247 = NBRC 16224 TaxID=1123024 RepID=A0A511D8C8_9PSEU|nr:GNAT family acetyltransferase [Pseudonocardia asaccharolytica DSM 44247 = NBRC 16224]